MVKFNDKAFRDAMVDKRTADNVTLATVAKQLKIPFATLQRIEQYREPSLTNYAKICGWLGKPLTYFLTNKKK
jgi:transcriptional regulator with XRE-family HTH domain